MAPASNEEQFKFLISCIRYSNNGKVDFGQVAAECKIVSKGAAAKRYERMMRAHGIAPNAAAIKRNPFGAPKAERRGSTVSTNKKRKADQFVEENITADDDEAFMKIKPDPGKDKEVLSVKGEEKGQQLTMSEAANLMQYYGDSSSSTNPSTFGADNYNFGGSSGFGASSMTTSSGSGSGWDMCSRTYGFSAPHRASMSNAVPRSSFARTASTYRGACQYSTDGQGGAETPVILE